MKLEKFTAALDHLKGFDVNLYVGEEVYKGKLLGVESDHVVLETESKYIFYYRIDKIQAITKNTKDFKAQKSNAHFKQTQSLMELLQSFQNTWVSILSIHKQRFNGVLAEVDSDFVTIINGEERILLKLDYVSNILKGFIKEEEKAEEKSGKANSQNQDSSGGKKDSKDKKDSDKGKNEKKSEKKEDNAEKTDGHSNKAAAAQKADNKSTKKEAAVEKREHKSDKQANTHHNEQGKSDKKSKHENEDTEKLQHVTVVQQTNAAPWSRPIKSETREGETEAGTNKDKSQSLEKSSASKGHSDKKQEMTQKDKPKEEPKMAKPKPLPPKEKDKPKHEAKHDAPPAKQQDPDKSEAAQKEKHSNEMIAEKNNTSYVWKPISQDKKSSRFAGEPITATNEKKGSVSPESAKDKGKSRAIADKPAKTDNVRNFPFGGEFKAFDNARSFPFAGEPAANDTARAFPFAGYPNKVKKTSGFLNF